MTAEDLALAKNLYEMGAPATYLLFLIVLWHTNRKDNREWRAEAAESSARYEALLRETVESLTRVAEEFDKRDGDNAAR